MGMQFKTQVLVLGSGPGGYSAAFRCADLGINTTIIERYPNLGGVCLNVGCIPSKTLLNIAKLIQVNKNINKYGILLKNNDIDIDIEKISKWKTNIINKIAYNLLHMAKLRNVKIINGLGQFINNNTIKILNHQKISEITFDYAIIATGSHPISLPCMPDDKRIWDSTDALSLKSIPKKLLIIGSGAIGLEIATIYSALGVTIDIIEIHDQIIPCLDEDVAKFFYKTINNNIKIMTNTEINKIYNQDDGIYVQLQNKINLNLKHTNRYDCILVAIGRNPNSHNLNLKNIGINTDKHGFVIINNQMRTNIPNIFAIGDIIGHPMLAHKSIYEGHIVAEIISGKKHYYTAKVIPSIIYTHPEIAWVGYTEKEAKFKNINYKVTTFPWTALGKAIASDCTEGITKLIFDNKTHRIIGGTVIGSHASELIGEIALSIEMGCDVEDITLTMHAHPTLYESIKLASSIYNGSITDLLNFKK